MRMKEGLIRSIPRNPAGCTVSENFSIRILFQEATSRLRVIGAPKPDFDFGAK